MTKKLVGILIGTILLSSLSLLNVYSEENISLRFAKLIRDEHYKEAYALIAPESNKGHTEEEFIQWQKDTRVAMFRDAGMNTFKHLERVDIAFSSPLNENTLKYLFSRKLPDGEYFNIFQFVFESDKVAMFKVTYDSTGIIGYEFDPDLAAIYQQNSLPYKRVVIE